MGPELADRHAANRVRRPLQPAVRGDARRQGIGIPGVHEEDPGDDEVDAREARGDLLQPIIMRSVVCLCFAMAVATPAVAQVDLAGEWGALNGVSEDQPHRNPGATLGDYTGLPINDAARQKARSWDASILSQPEAQAKPHPVQYSLRGGGGPNLRIVKVVDPLTGRLIAYQFNGLFGRADRVIWMDGRPHPSEYAEHTWSGFSTGEWVDGKLKVTTTHMKMGVIQRNGVPTSPRGTMVEFWMRHGGHLSAFTWI